MLCVLVRQFFPAHFKQKINDKIKYFILEQCVLAFRVNPLAKITGMAPSFS